MSVVEVKYPPTLRMINAAEEKSPAEWEALYPDVWMLLEVSQEDECEIYKARLVATAEHNGELTPLSRTYGAQGIVHLITRGQPKEQGPVLVASV